MRSFIQYFGPVSMLAPSGKRVYTSPVMAAIGQVSSPSAGFVQYVLMLALLKHGRDPCELLAESLSKLGLGNSRERVGVI